MKISLTRLDGRVIIATAGLQGPAGPAGSSGGAITMTAAESLGGHRMVVSNSSGRAEYADHSDLSHAQIVAGMTAGAAAAGADVTVIPFGEIIMGGWAWTPESAVYLSTAGQVVQTPPSTGFLLVVGFAVSETKILLRIGQPIII